MIIIYIKKQIETKWEVQNHQLTQRWGIKLIKKFSYIKDLSKPDSTNQTWDSGDAPHSIKIFFYPITLCFT